MEDCIRKQLEDAGVMDTIHNLRLDLEKTQQPDAAYLLTTTISIFRGILRARETCNDTGHPTTSELEYALTNLVRRLSYFKVS